jgi:transcriptional repressor NrdR
MHCPTCNATDTKVIDSRLLPEGQSVRRRRKCESCDFRFTTYESFRAQMPAVVKHDERRENYNREKILRGLKKACQKRPISSDQIDQLIDTIEKSMVDNYPKEISSSTLGELIMEKLYQLDPVSYVRFASFYWEFKDIESFVKNLQNLTPKDMIKRKKGQKSDELQ